MTIVAHGKPTCDPFNIPSMLITLICTGCITVEPHEKTPHSQTPDLIQRLARHMPEEASGWLLGEESWRGHRVLTFRAGLNFADAPLPGVGHFEGVCAAWFLDVESLPVELLHPLSAAPNGIVRLPAVDAPNLEWVGTKEQWAANPEPRLLLVATSQALLRDALGADGRNRDVNRTRLDLLAQLPGMTVDPTCDIAAHWAPALPDAPGQQIVAAARSNRQGTLRLWFRDTPEHDPKYDRWNGETTFFVTLSGRRTSLMVAEAAFDRAIRHEGWFVVHEEFDAPPEDIAPHLYLMLVLVFGLQIAI
jgi:hypothetical protein